MCENFDQGTEPNRTVVEIKYREFLSRLLIGAKSALKGNDVFIGDDELIKLIVNFAFI